MFPEKKNKQKLKLYCIDNSFLLLELFYSVTPSQNLGALFFFFFFFVPQKNMVQVICSEFFFMETITTGRCLYSDQSFLRPTLDLSHPLLVDKNNQNSRYWQQPGLH